MSAVQSRGVEYGEAHRAYSLAKAEVEKCRAALAEADRVLTQAEMKRNSAQRALIEVAQKA